MQSFHVNTTLGPRLTEGDHAQAQYNVLELAIETTWSKDHFKHFITTHLLSALAIK